ncbi:unnamed protein product [Symbiodinium natans]|uniref:Uncharacterized protein n=1 Tax=Symbiodinium natans TaxID=878477 RepID=A0A812R7U7_9DINO|nr:unnamed protein product [Symbiodinium natans]
MCLFGLWRALVETDLNGVAEGISVARYRVGQQQRVLWVEAPFRLPGLIADLLSFEPSRWPGPRDLQSLIQDLEVEVLYGEDIDRFLQCVKAEVTSKMPNPFTYSAAGTKEPPWLVKRCRFRRSWVRLGASFPPRRPIAK